MSPSWASPFRIPASPPAEDLGQQPDMVRRYIRAQVEAVHRIYTDKETALQVLTKYFRGNVEREILEKTWELLTKALCFPRNNIRRLRVSNSF